MNTPHNFAKEICHWANGGKIQFRHLYKEDSLEGIGWVDTEREKTVIGQMFQDTDYEWRIKPEIFRYRVALMQGSEMVYTRTYDNCGDVSGGNFIRWLTEQTEIEV